MSGSILFCLGGLLGSIGSTILMSLLAISKAEEIDREKHQRYKEGYEKGYKDAKGW